MDSISAQVAASYSAQLHRIAEQESTDFDKALRNIAAPLVVAVGFSGGRFDHELAAMHVLLRYPERPCVVLGQESLAFLCPPRLTLDLEKGTPFSLFPFGAVGVASDGLEWPTDPHLFDPLTKIGTSNRVMGPVTLAADAPAMMVILPSAVLDCVVTRLAALGPDERWPARAK